MLFRSPIEDTQSRWTEIERVGIEHALRYSAVGSAESVRGWLQRFIELTNADEIMVTAQIFDHAARLRSIEIVSEIRETIR